MDEILTAEQVAHILQVHPFTVLKFIKKGKLKASKLGRVYRIRRSDVDKFLDSQIERAEPEQKQVVKKAKSKEKKVQNVKVSQEIAKPQDILKPQPESARSPKPEPIIVIQEVKTDDEENTNSTSDIDHYVIEIKNK